MAARSASASSLGVAEGSSRSGRGGGALTAALRRRGLQALGLALIAAAALIAVALWGYEPADPSWNQATDAAAANPLGGLGAHLADALLQSFGYAGYVVPFALACWGARLAAEAPPTWPWLPAVALPVALLAGAVYLAPQPVGLDWTFRAGYGGFVGDFLLFRAPPDATAQQVRLVGGLVALAALAVTAGLRWPEVRWAALAGGRAALRPTLAGIGWLIALWRRRRDAGGDADVGERPSPAPSPFARSGLTPSGFDVVRRLAARLGERLRRPRGRRDGAAPGEEDVAAGARASSR
ncbi:MAG TPA: DNA translocase FtsK 4TM domain-containing protein, partial [Geminicoccaceae bacterium]|nr:DNA translocase FtsK 4TM domain-containing protein [Geminicoccaceae bacterium]